MTNKTETETEIAEFVVPGDTNEFYNTCHAHEIEIIVDDDPYYMVKGTEEAIAILDDDFERAASAEYDDGYQHGRMDAGMDGAEPQPYRSRHTGGLGYDGDAYDSGYEDGWAENPDNQEGE